VGFEAVLAYALEKKKIGKKLHKPQQKLNSRFYWLIFPKKGHKPQKPYEILAYSEFYWIIDSKMPDFHCDTVKI
jgi:hypothetical protein